MLPEISLDDIDRVGGEKHTKARRDALLLVRVISGRGAYLRVSENALGGEDALGAGQDRAELLAEFVKRLACGDALFAKP